MKTSNVRWNQETSSSANGLPVLCERRRLMSHTSGRSNDQQVARPGSVSCRIAGFLQTGLIISCAAAVLASRAQPAIADDSQLAHFATRVGEMLRQVAAAERPEATPKAKGPDLEQNAAIQKLVQETEGDMQVHLRPGHWTVRQVRGALTSPANRAALLASGDSHERTVRKFLAAHRGLMKLADPDQEVTLVQNQRDELGHQHLRFGQQHKGLPVWPAELGAHFDPAGNLTLVEGAYVPTPDLQVIKPAVSREDSVERARTALAPGRKTSASVPQLIIYAPLDLPPRLAWKLELTASLSAAWLIVVDAQDGRILHQSPRVCDGNVPGSGVDLFGTTRPLNVWQNGNTYYLADTSKGSFDPAFDPILDPHGVITVVDANGASRADAPHSGTIVTAASANLWNIPAAISAAFNFSETYDYYLQQLGRNSLDDRGGNITAIVRVGNYNNASWNGNLRVMLFGDVQPFAGALDVVAHEMTHGVTQNSAGLIYQNQSGALNEAFSDIFGETVEARTRGRNDWLLGKDLGEPARDLKNPGSLISSTTGKPYPSKMSEFAQLSNTSNSDHGGVHINSSIINHAFYLLAEGLNGAIGLRKAETIFYRALTQHLFAQSEFVDCRLACVVSAEELYGKDGTEARLTAQAFDAVEILASPATPEPTPLPTVAGPDSVLFVNYDPGSASYVLGRREAARGDNAAGLFLAAGLTLARPSVTGDGTIALFVSSAFDLCALNTADPNSRQCLGFAGQVHSVAISPDSRLAAFVLRDVATGTAEGKITLLDLASNKVSTHNLVAPSTDGVSVDTVLYADSMTFTTDSTALIYDAVSQLRFGNGPTVERWSVYSLRLDTGVTSILVPPQDGIDTGNPAVGRAGNRYLVYDAREVASGTSTITVLDLFTGESAAVGTARNTFGYPTFLGDESGVVFSAPDPAAVFTGFSLFKQDLTGDRLHPQGTATVWYDDANLGVVYRRGAFQATNSLPTVSLAVSADQIPAQGQVTLTATATDSDGTVARVEFYDGSTKIAQVTAAPHSFLWRNVPAGNHLVTARAIDNLGGTADSPPRFLTVRGNGGGNAPPTVSLKLSAGRVTAGESVTLTATASDPDGTIAWVEFYDSSTKLAQVEAAPYAFVWQNVPAGNHLLTARAVDNLGAETRSSAGFLTASGAGNSNKPPTVSLNLSAGRVPAGGTVTLTATASDPDGTITRVEFYDASTKLAQVESAPYTFIWQNVPAGNHLLTAVAVDNLGAQTRSSAGFLTASGNPPGSDRPQFGIKPIAQGTVRLTVSGQPGYYIISMSEDLRTWVDIYPVTIEAGSGSGSIDDSTGSTSSRLFFRVRREP